MDAVILAAGRGSRLDGITAPFLKPLLVINGRPLVATAADIALRLGCERIIVVVAPENAAHITHVIPMACHMAVQRWANGPGNALHVGLQLVRSEEVLVIMSDNVISLDDAGKVAMGTGNVIGTTLVPGADAERFTRLEDGNPPRWVEKERLDPRIESAICWVGPIKVNVGEISRAIRNYESTAVPLGPLFNELTEVSTVPVTSIDIGIPEALQ